MQLRPARDGFRYTEALATADEHVIFKNGAKEIAAQEGMSITYMAEFNEREGNWCHIHLSIAATETGGTCSPPSVRVRPIPRWPAGRDARARALLRAERQLLTSAIKPALAPTALAWGQTTGLPRCGLSDTARAPVETRLPGADVNPYLALSAMIAAGLDGSIGAALEPAFEGNAYESDEARVPDTLSAARELFAGSELARDAFGERSSITISTTPMSSRVQRAVTDWERFRGFERL